MKHRQSKEQIIHKPERRSFFEEDSRNEQFDLLASYWHEAAGAVSAANEKKGRPKEGTCC